MPLAKSQRSGTPARRMRAQPSKQVVDHRTYARQAIKEMGGPGQVHLGLAQFTKQVQTMEARRKELTKRHPDKWVALYDDHITVSETLRGVLRSLDKSGISRKNAIVEFLSTKPKGFVLVDR